MPNSTNSLDKILALAGRVVRTEAGAKLYGKPIGSPILPDEKSPAAEAAATPSSAKSTPVAPAKPVTDTDAEVKAVKPGSRPVTLERVQSLQAQAKAAIRTGDKAQIKKLKEEFNIALSSYAKGRPTSEVLAELKKSLHVEKK